MTDIKKTKTRGNVIVNDIKVGDVHYEYDFGYGIQCQVTEAPKLENGKWTWKSKNLKSGVDINYLIPDINSENGGSNSQFGPKLYDHEAYKGIKYI